ncbi:LysR family transcriptional regulator [Robertkochia aurantiaca]|uniref:LysR family transcriptional regulator n=1 Tax=Robertkochia aurantiaca TaxID=2873700 RepID=UPI001CCDA84D|nr:LysR family transcriptional regulator [Robertkochia sp. 3YJGBD-33]
MDYTLNQLRIFLKVVELGSITKAAEELYLTQPAVSIQLKNLQDQFEIPLTEVIGRKLYVTQFGHEVAESAQKIIEEVHQMKHKTLSYKGYVTGELRITIASTAKYVMPYLITDFLKLHPGIDLIMDVTNKTKVVKSLERNEVDFSMVSVLPENLNIDRIQLMQNKLYLFSSGNDEKQIEGPDDLKDLPLIYREKGSATRAAMEEYIASHNITVSKKMELTSNEAVKQAVMAGLGYSIMPLIGIRNEMGAKSLRLIPMQDLPVVTHWNLIWLKDKKMSPAAAAYLEYLKINRDRLIKEKFSWYEAYIH